MAAFTTIAAATVAVGGSAAKGFLAGDAAKDAAREAGRLEIEQEQLQQESIAKLEQNFLDAVRATTDIYDKQLQLSNVQGSQLVEAAQEGDQRGVAATAGKVKQVQDVASGQIADKMALQKLDIDMKRAAADEMDAARVAALMDDRAAAAGLEAKAKRNEAEALSAESTGAFIDAGVAALSAGITAFGGAEGKAAQSLVDSGEAASLTEATNMLDGLDNKMLKQVAKSGTLTGLASAATPGATYDGPTFTPSVGFNLQDDSKVQVVKSNDFGNALFNLKNIATNLNTVKKNANAPATPNPVVDQAMANPKSIIQFLYPNMTEDEIIGGGFGTPEQYRDYFTNNIFGGIFTNNN